MDARRKEDNSAMEKIGARVRQRALSGTEASTIGFVLVAYIGAFAGLGYWLDTLFKTSWIVAVGVLLGAIVGFREMFRIANKVTRESIAEDAEKSQTHFSQARESAKSSGLSTQPKIEVSESQPEAERSRPRIFSVPPPPAASFENKGATRSTPVGEPASDEELIERLLNEKEFGEKDEEAK
jgi:F0F1-type ATP synthase assembly protein I